MIDLIKTFIYQYFDLFIVVTASDLIKLIDVVDPIVLIQVKVFRNDIEHLLDYKALSPFSDTYMEPKIIRSTCWPRIIPKLKPESKKLAPGKVVMVCFPALIKSASSSPSNGNGPMPKTPFSLWNSTEISVRT